MAKLPHTFSVECPTQAGECVAITGSSQELGAWSKADIKLLENRHNSDIWSLSLDLSPGQHFYRYCVVVLLQTGKVIVRRWETHFNPRRVGKEPQMEKFGTQKCGNVSVQRGWLTQEMVIQFKLRNSGVVIWKKRYSNYRLWLKLTPLTQEARGGSHESEESMDMHELRQRQENWPIVETAELSKERCQRRIQEQFGVQINQAEGGDFVLFEVQLLNLNNVAFLVDVYGLEEGRRNEDLPEHIGMCYIYSDYLNQTIGKLEATITSMKYQPIGRLQLDYLLMHPIPDTECNFAESQQHWNEEWNGLDVGHRGLGNSYTTSQHCSNVRENTIASMRDAKLHGADMVEFDVQVSSDLVPIIYHEFTLCLMTKTKHGGEIMLEIPVKDLSLDQLQELKVHHPSEKAAGVKTFPEEPEGDQDHAAFPTLERALSSLDADLGFNIELKFAQQFRDGVEEMKNQMEMNIFLDQVLKTVLKFGGERKIVFSSFNPDVCTMIVNKQNKYPAMLLTQGINTKYKDYMDPRTWTIPNASWFVKMAGLLGISAMAEDIMRDPTQVELVKSQGQVLFSWTDDRNDKDTVSYLKSLKVNGIIYDRMDQHNSKEVKESIFLLESRKGKSDSGYSGGSSPIASP